MQSDQSEDKNFTTDCSTISSADEFKDKGEEDKKIVTAMGVNSNINRRNIGDSKLIKQKQIVAKKLSHLDIDEWAKFEELLRGEDILA